MKKKKIATLLLALSLSLTALSACSNGDTNQNANENQPENTETPTVESSVPTAEGYGILREAEINKIGSLNPLTYTASYSSDQIKRCSMLLYYYFPNEDYTFTTLKGEMASEDPIQMDDEGKVWQIKLHDGLVWETGEVINADDIMYTWQMMLDPKLANIRASNFASDVIEIENAMAYFKGECTWEEVGLKKIDDLTLEITTVSGHDARELMTHLAHPANCVINEEMFEACMNADRTENTYGTTADKWVSCGPFLVSSWINDAEINFVKNPDYVYSDLIWLAGIQTKVVADANTQMQLFESNEIEYVKLSAADYLKYEEDPRVLMADSNAVRHLVINSANPEQPILGNEKFRQALYFALDRESLAALNKQLPAAYIVPTTHIIDLENGTAFRDTAEGMANVPANNGYDPEKAKTLFDEALAEEGLSSVSITLLYADSDLMKSMSEFAQQNFVDVFGADKFELNLQAMPASQLSEIRNGWPTNPTSYDISWAGWISTDLMPWNAFKYWTTYYSNKNEPFFSEEFDEVFYAANFGTERFEEGARLAYVAEMERMLIEPAILVPAVQDIDKYLKSDRLELTMQNWANSIEFGWIYGKIVD